MAIRRSLTPKPYADKLVVHSESVVSVADSVLLSIERDHLRLILRGVIGNHVWICNNSIICNVVAVGGGAVYCAE